MNSLFQFLQFSICICKESASDWLQTKIPELSWWHFQPKLTVLKHPLFELVAGSIFGDRRLGCLKAFFRCANIYKARAQFPSLFCSLLSCINTAHDSTCLSYCSSVLPPSCGIWCQGFISVIQNTNWDLFKLYPAFDYEWLYPSSKDESGNTIFHNHYLQTTTNEHPCKVQYRKMVIQERERIQRSVAVGSSLSQLDKKENEGANNTHSVSSLRYL